MPIESIKLEEFTVFKEIEINCATGINVFIGENGTGKTHLLKSVYSANKKEKEKYFTTKEVRLGEALIKGNNIDNVFIPSKDMLTHSESFMSINDKYDMPFDRTYYEVISKSLLPKLKETPEISKEIVAHLEKIIGGKVVVEKDVFYILQDGKCRRIEFALESEGIKKIAILWQLIMNGTIEKNTGLFLDEPESNLNPKLIPELVQVLLELARNGVQIFIATHDYIFAKYIEVFARDSDNITFHSLYKTELGGVKCESSPTFRDLKHNVIVESFDQLIQKVFDLNLGE
ncbi:MAG: hypothetical protein BEN19_00395 [Epulopiscium sp. Nuni2H_MBin003]|nr:MAG: hypothetical protein BEN19_00395 [Epulopiscium sp. Nuni2H_MBin003]